MEYLPFAVIAILALALLVLALAYRRKSKDAAGYNSAYFVALEAGQAAADEHAEAIAALRNAQDAAFAVRARSYTADLDRLDAEHAAALQQAAEERASAVARESGRADANERDAEAFRKLKLGYKWLRETNLTVKGERVTVWSPDDPECGPNSAFPMRLYGHEYLLKDKAPEPEGTP